MSTAGFLHVVQTPPLLGEALNLEDAKSRAKALRASGPFSTVAQLLAADSVLDTFGALGADSPERKQLEAQAEAFVSENAQSLARSWPRTAGAVYDCIKATRNR